MLRLFRSIIMTDFLVKFFSIVLAVFIWMYVYSERSMVSDLTVQMTIIAPENAILNSPESYNFTIKVKGPSELIEKLSRPFEVVYKEPFLKEEFIERNLMLDAQRLGLPDGISLVSPVRPVQLALDQRITLSLPVIPETTGNTAEGYTAKIQRAEPESISISGPKRMIREFSKLMTDPIDLTGRILSFDTLVHINIDSKYTKIVIENRLIRVFVKVQPIIIEREFTVPVRVTQEPDSRYISKSIQPSTVKIVVRGPQAVIERLGEDDILVYVNADGFSTAGIHTDVLTHVLLPGEIELVGTAPRVEIFLVEKSPLEKNP